MRVLVSEKLSPHRFKTPEGYLICTDAILARTGKQTYRRREVFGDMSDKGEEEIEINRDAKEVFNPVTLASFENKPLTIEHPNEDVNPENHHDYAVGFTRDIKRGRIDGNDVMLGTIVVTDAEAIKDIESGELVELSCGYDCDVVDEANPQQRNIRGNHVALCERGRAGIARIVDSTNEEHEYSIWVKNQFGEYEVVKWPAVSKEAAVKEFLAANPKYARIGLISARDSADNTDSSRSTNTSDDLWGLVKEPKYRYFLARYYDKKWDIDDSVAVIRAENENDAEDKLKKAGIKYDSIQELNHSEYIKFARVTKTIDSTNVVLNVANCKTKQMEDMKDMDYSKESKLGYKVLEMYRDGGRLHAILKRANDYVVALGYDTNDGTWAQGRYVDKYENALATLKEEKPGAKKIQDCDMNDDLEQSSSKEALKKNIATEIKAGKDPKQAAAIAYSVQRANDSIDDILNKIRTTQIKEGEQLTFNAEGYLIDIQSVGKDIYQQRSDKRWASPKTESNAWIRVWKDNQKVFDESGPINVARDRLIQFMKTRVNDSLKTFKVKYTKDSKTYIQKVKAKDLTDAVNKVKDAMAVPFASQSEAQAAMREIEPLYQRAYQNIMQRFTIGPWRNGYEVTWEREIADPSKLQSLVGSKYVLTRYGVYKGQ